MGQTTTSKSVLLNNAAKDDAVGLNGDYIFNINDLLANDPGGAAKVDVTKQFFFGDTAADQANQAQYLADHHITDLGNGDYRIEAGATDFNYFVQIGNKGTWSTAAVDVTAPVPHAGPALFTENFDGYNDDVQQTYQDNGVDVFASVNLNGANDWQSSAPKAGDNAPSDPTHSELGANGYGTIESTSGGFWFDTMNSPGQVNISHAFNDSTAAVAGKTSVLSFDAAYQDLNYQGNHYETDANAAFEFRIDGVKVAEITAADFTNNHDNMVHFDIDISAYAGAGTAHTLQMIDTTATAGFTGFAIDSIHINDWVV